MYLGTFDFILIIIILIFNILVCKFPLIKNYNWIFNLVILLLFGFVIPFFSMGFEVKNVTNNLTNVDSFTLLYTIFRFPTWWFFGILEIIFLKSQFKHTKIIDGQNRNN